MPSPFPGMDPYLENPALWPNVHHGLISEIQAQLNKRLRPKYVAGVEERVYVSDDDDPGRKLMVPDVRVDELPVQHRNGTANGDTATLTIAEPITITLLNEEIKEAYVVVHETGSGTLVAIIEVLSPSNKIPGSAGRLSFMGKRREIFATPVHWVEIDLLRAGKLTSLNAELRRSDYRTIVSRGHDHERAQYWPVSVRQPLPVIGIPLRKKDPDEPLDLGGVLQSAYDRAAWDLKINYDKPPDPPLSPEDARWAGRLLRAKGLR